MNIVLHEPEIPFNTGAVGRTCVATHTRLHLIEPFGFVLNDKNLRRAGMDYWQQLDVSRYVSYEEFLRANHLEGVGRGGGQAQPSDAAGLPEGQTAPRLWFATTKAQRCYTEVSFGPDDYIMFGKESAGIPEELLLEHPESCIRIPMWGDIRSLNLSNSVAVMLYEALRQNGFEAMQKRGELHHHRWSEQRKA